MSPARNAWRIVALTLLVAGTVRADTLVAESAEEMAMEGRFGAASPSGVIRVNDFASTGELVIENATGELVVWTRERLVNAYLGNPLDTTVDAQSEDAEKETILLDGASLRVRMQREYFGMTLIAHADGALAVAGNVDETGHPRRNPTEFRGQTNSNGTLPRAQQTPETLEWGWDAGWLMVGHHQGRSLGLSDEPVEVVGFPRLPSATIAGAGGFAMQVKGGNLTLDDGTGEPREIRLGNWTTSSLPGVDRAQWRLETSRSFIFRGSVGALSAPAGGSWAFGAPDMTWTLDGRAQWTRATGVAILDGDAFPFEDATVDLVATGELMPRPPAVPGVG